MDNFCASALLVVGSEGIKFRGKMLTAFDQNMSPHVSTHPLPNFSRCGEDTPVAPVLTRPLCWVPHI